MLAYILAIAFYCMYCITSASGCNLSNKDLLLLLLLCLECDSWGLLEIDMLLTDDILEIGKRSDLNSTRDVLLSPAMYIQLPYINMEI